jgi:hypothetical protein
MKRESRSGWRIRLSILKTAVLVPSPRPPGNREDIRMETIPNRIPIANSSGYRHEPRGRSIRKPPTATATRPARLTMILL